MSKISQPTAPASAPNVCLGVMVLFGLAAIAFAMAHNHLLNLSELLVAGISLAFAAVCLCLLRLNRLLAMQMAGVQQQDKKLREFGRAIANSACAVIITDTEGRIDEVNPKFTQITGYSQDDVSGWALELLNPGESEFNPETDQIWVRSILQDGWSGEILNRRRDGTLFWLSVSVSEITDDNGVSKYIISCLDINDLKQANEQMKQLALYDPLTGLANRRLFVDRLEQSIKATRRDRKQLALMFLDLDQFKRINDTLGHDAGDLLLKTIAQRLRLCVRDKDTVARLGGDEFTVLLTDIEDTLAATHVANQILGVLKEPVMLGQHEVIVSTSIGITISPEDGVNADTLMKNADLALYRAKERGRDCHHYFTEELNAKALKQLILEQELRHAMHFEEFSLYFQPQVDLATGQIVSVEALLRWQHPKRGMVMPNDFISVAEESGLIVPIGKWVLRNACLQLKMLHDLTGSTIKVAVNLSARQFEDKGLVAFIGDVLTETGLSPACLELEVTESMLMGDVDGIVERLTHLKATGITISIDDFGSGYSSLSYLKRLPVDILKVDRQFVRDIPDDLNDMEITSAVIAVAHKLNLKVVAEGVEDIDQRDFLIINKCDFAQGYLFSKPLTMETLYPLMASIQTNEQHSAHSCFRKSA